MGCFPGRVSGSPAGLSINRNDMPGHDITDFFAAFLQAEGKEFFVQYPEYSGESIM